MLPNCQAYKMLCKQRKMYYVQNSLYYMLGVFSSCRRHLCGFLYGICNWYKKYTPNFMICHVKKNWQYVMYFILIFGLFLEYIVWNCDQAIPISALTPTLELVWTKEMFLSIHMQLYWPSSQDFDLDRSFSLGNWQSLVWFFLANKDNQTLLFFFERQLSKFDAFRSCRMSYIYIKQKKNCWMHQVSSLTELVMSSIQ